MKNVTLKFQPNRSLNEGVIEFHVTRRKSRNFRKCVLPKPIILDLGDFLQCHRCDPNHTIIEDKTLDYAYNRNDCIRPRCSRQFPQVGRVHSVYSRVPSNLVAIVSRNVFCGASRPFLLGILMDGVVADGPPPPAATALRGHLRSAEVTAGGTGSSTASYVVRRWCDAVAAEIRCIMSGTECIGITSRKGSVDAEGSNEHTRHWGGNWCFN